MSGGPGDERVLDVLANRASVLAAVRDVATTKRDLVDELSVSRSTVDRAIRDLETHDLVRRTDGGYRATLTGRLLLSARQEYARRVTDTAAVGDLVSHLPPAADVPLETFATADAYRPDQPDPHRPTTVLRDLANEATHNRGVLVEQATPNATDVVRRRVVEGDLDIEYLISPAMREYLWSEQPQLVAELITDGGVDFYETEPLPFDYALLTTPEATHFLVVVYDGRGTLQGVLHSTEEAAVQWGASTFESHLDDATWVEPPVDG